MKTRLFVISLLVLFLAGCNLPDAASTSGIAAPPAWIDAPLDGSVLPLAPVAIVAHASDPTGIERFEFSIDGSVVAQGAGDGPSGVILTAHKVWTPALPGTYTLQVRAQNAGGSWGSPAEAIFRIGATETPTLTATSQSTPTLTETRPPNATATASPTITPASVGTLTPTATLTSTASPTAAQIDFTLLQAGPAIFYHSKTCGANDPNCQATCSPNQLDINVQVSDPDLVKSLVLFFMLTGKKSSTAWNEGVSMKPLGGGVYEYKLVGDSVPADKSYDQAVFSYQFVATDGQHTNLARSKVFSDVTLSACP